MFGLNIDPNNPRGNPEPAELRALGVEMVRYTFYDSSGGDQLDPRQVQFYSSKARAYHEAGIKSLVILTYDSYPNRPSPDAGDGEWDQYVERFAKRSAQIAQELAPWQPAFQVWNEPDHPVHLNYVPTLRVAVFGRMLRRTYDSIKAVGPFTVVTAGLASGNPSWLTRVMQSLNGALPADAVAFHPYGQRPERNWPRPDWGFGFVGDLLNNYYRAGQQKPLWITEMGVKEEDLGNNRQQVAEFLRRFYHTLTNSYRDKVQQLQWFCYSDGMVPTFGLVDAASNRKPAFDAYRDAATSTPRRPAKTPPRPAVTAPPPPPAFSPPPPPPIQPPAPPFSPPPVSPGLPVPLPAGPSGPTAQELAQLADQMAVIQAQTQQLQSQLTEIVTQLEQLLAQQAQLGDLVRQWQVQPGPAGPQAPLMQNVAAQLAKHPTKQFPSRPLDQIQQIIIHHTAIPASIGAERVADYRVNKQSWPGIGYHYFISGDGAIQQTNELTTLSTHAGNFDPVAIGVCFAGDFTDVPPTSSQIEAGAQLIAWLLSEFHLPVEAISGYKELVNTQSPGLQWDSGARWGDQLRARIQAWLSS